MGERSLIPDNLFKSNINPENQMYVDEYSEVLRKENLRNVTLILYLKAMENIFKYKGNWHINFKDYTKDICETFTYDLLDNDISPSRIDTYTVLLNKMSNYFKDSHTDEFPRNFLKNLKRFNDKSGKNIPSRALKPKELDLVKQYLNSKNRETLQYIFNVFFYTDIKKSDFDIYNPQNANFEKKRYEYMGETRPFIPEIEESLLKVKDKKIKFSMICYYLPHIAEYLQEKGEYEEGKSFSFEDINKSRKRYFINCPVCQKAVENIAENWVIAQYENSDYKQLVCINCKGVSLDE